MSNIGSYLKQSRNSYHLSLKDVHNRCDVTGSKLSRTERGEGRPLVPSELRS